MIIKKTAAEIDKMARAGDILVRTMDLVAGKVRPGVTTGDLDAAAEKFIRSQGATPAFKGYRGFPGSICSSPNDMVVHGIPSDAIVLEDGDILSVDCGAIVEGWHGDAAFTAPVGTAAPRALALIEVADAALAAAIDAMVDGGRLGDIGAAVQGVVDGSGFAVVRDYTGHGIGTEFHNGLIIPHYDAAPHYDDVIEVGMVFTVEPMLNLGSGESAPTWDDGWTVVTADGSRSAQFENTLVITET